MIPRSGRTPGEGNGTLLLDSCLGNPMDRGTWDHKASQIENIEALVEKVYKPTIEQLTARVEKLQAEVERLRDDNNRLKDENDQLRDAIREIDPTIVPSKRSVNAQRQTRGSNGQFAKKEEK